MAPEQVTDARVETSFRFSLKTLLLLTTIACVVIAPFAWFGGIYLTSALLSVAMVAACAYAYANGSTGLMLAIGVGSVVVGFMVPLVLMMVLGAFLLHAMANGIACLFGAVLRLRPQTMTLLLSATAVGVYAFILFNGGSSVRELIALKEQYPLQAISHRLAFEGAAHEVGAESHSQLPVPLSPRVDEELAAQEQRLTYRRVWALRELHENMSRHFAAAAGFGVTRMPTFRPYMVEQESRPVIELPLPLRGLPAQTDSKELNRLHQEILFEFADPDSFGYVQSRDNVAGFEAHSFAIPDSRSDDVDPESVRTAGTESWQLIRLELVSLLRHPEARVYVSSVLPKMDELDAVPNRPLNDFEADALSKLRRDTNLVVEDASESIVMVGAVRASNDCLQCHEGARGKLLGAFSYELSPVPTSASSDAPTEALDTTIVDR